MMTPGGPPGARQGPCLTCKGQKLVTVKEGGKDVRKPCPSCGGTGLVAYRTK